MKSKFTRALAVLLALTMVLSTAACGKKSGAEDTKAADTTAATTTEAATTAAASEGTEAATTAGSEDYVLGNWVFAKDPKAVKGTVRFWIPFKGTQGMDAMIAEFNETYPNVKVELNTYKNNGEGNISVNTAIDAGEIDVLASFGLSNAYKRWKMGLYEDLTSKVDELKIDLKKEWGADQFTYDGKVYTFPCGGLSYFIAINKTDWDNAGLGEIPTEWTWDEYLEASKAMTHTDENGNKIFGGSDGHSIDYFTYVANQVNGGNRYYSADGKTCMFDQPLILNALKREIKAENEDEIWYPKTLYRSNNFGPQDTFLTHKVASGVNNNLARFIVDKENYPTDWITYFAPYPVEEKGQTNYMSGIATFSHAGICVDKKRSAEDEEAAWYFLAWYSTYGVKYLSIAGHQPAWKGTDTDDLINVIFGSEEEAAKLVDVESFKRCVVNFDNPGYVDTFTAGLNDLGSILNNYAMEAFNGNMTAEDAMKAATEEGNEAIAKESN